ncbi:hypothetical protein C7B61_08355 [filamentous cyanobacterium CCP1]|nr:hypothetical protein C7B76_16510 [filamentous cyanobacterium CCP2]PSB67015.1 hypothetical protein C7B61_08355 [filamentous cyanobacterium CCP1]
MLGKIETVWATVFEQSSGNELTYPDRRIAKKSRACHALELAPQRFKLAATDCGLFHEIAQRHSIPAFSR